MSSNSLDRRRAGVLAALDRMGTDALFDASKRQRRLLAFLCEKEVGGRGQELKAHAIAITALDRDEAFNPQNDSIVRVEMGRLRRILERYNALSDDRPGVKISLLKGSYRPVFTFKNDIPDDFPAVGSRELCSSPNNQEISTRSNYLSKIHPAVFFGVAAILMGVIQTVNFVQPPLQINAAAFASASTQRQITIMATRIENGDQADNFSAKLIQSRLKEALKDSMNNFEIVSDEDKKFDQRLDLILRTSIWISMKTVTVSYLLVDADLSDVVLRGNVVIDVKNQTPGAVDRKSVV